MTDLATPSRRFRSPGREATARLAEILATAVCLYGMDGLAHLHLTVGAWLWLWCGMSAVRLVLGNVTHAGWRHGGRIVLTLGLLALLDAGLKLEITAGQLVYLTALVEAVVGAYRFALRRLAAPEPAGSGEALRLAAAALLGLVVIFPFVTDHFMGGSDAHWYGMMLVDFIHQARAGVFPIFVGQGESAFNGGVHPFRSAPLHLWLAGVLDGMTCRSLSVLALQHLTLVVSSVGAALAMYLALGELAPRRRGQALLVTAFFCFCPAQLAAIYAAEAYMTFMTYPWIVLTLYGNVRTFRREEDFAGWWWIAVGSALSWLSHPSVGVYVTIATLCLQLGWLVVKGRTWRGLVRGAMAGAAFAGLTLYYFVSMSETTTGGEHHLASSAFFVGGVALLMLALWCWATARRGRALLLLGLSLGILLLSQPILWVYLLVIVGLLLLVEGWRRWFPALAASEHRWEWIAGILLVAIFLAGWIAGRDFPGKGGTTDFSLGIARETLRQTWAPVPDGAVAVGGFQAGWPFMALFAISLLGGFRRESREQRVFAVTAIFFVLLYIPLPYFSEFFWGNLPDAMVTVMSISFDRRMFPVLIPVLAFAGFIGWGELDRGWLRRAAFVLLAVLLPWSTWEMAKYLRRGYAIKGSWQQTKNFYRPDTFLITRYAYDMLQLPDTLSHGIVDYRLESRILNERDFTTRLGPDQYARALERGGVRTLTLTGRMPEPGSPWLIFSPPLDIAPNQDWVLRFEFQGGFPPGFFILPTTNGLYREYAMPASGLQRSFGMQPGNHGVITLQNFTDSVQRYNWEYQRSGNFAPVAGEGEFARVSISHFDPNFLPVHVTSLRPYRASLTLDQPGWLETFRSWIPGYEATVNGQRVEVRESAGHLVMLPVPGGRSEVELRFAGTPRLWRALAASAAAWGLTLGAGLVVLIRRAAHE